MKKLVLIIVFICIISSIVGCSNINETDPQITKENSSVSSNDYKNFVLTNEEMLEDYDSIWMAFKGNSPFLGVIMRQHGEDYLDTTIANYRQKIVDLEATGDDSMVEFIFIIAESMNAACDMDRHAGLLNSYEFCNYQTIYRKLNNDMPDLADLQPWIDLLENPEIIDFYTYFDSLYDFLVQREIANYQDIEDSETESPSETEMDYEDTNLTFRVLEEERMAYIKVDSFATELMEDDLPQIRAFLEDVQNYENLIIDIQENDGGNTSYWEDAFVRPNISAPIETSFVRLMRDGDLANKFYSNNYENSSLTVEEVATRLEYTNLQQDDIKQFEYASELFDITKPEFNKKLFKGKIWLLVGSDVYSAAESFAVFCKASEFATLVGQTTGGGNTAGPILFELPNSHMLVSFDVEYTLNPDGSCSHEIGTKPDIESENPLQTVLDLINVN